MPFPSPSHPGGHPEDVFNPPGHAGPSYPYQPYYGPGGNVWNLERPFALEQAEAQMLEMAAAREDEMKDQEKRLFLEEYRYVGQQTVRPISTFVNCPLTDEYGSLAVRAPPYRCWRSRTDPR